MNRDTPITIGMMLDILSGEFNVGRDDEPISRYLSSAYGGSDRVISADGLVTALNKILRED